MDMKKYQGFTDNDILITSFYGPRADGFHNGIDADIVVDQQLYVPVDEKNGGAKYKCTQNEWRTYFCPLVNKKVKGLFVKILNVSNTPSMEWEIIHGDKCDLKVGQELTKVHEKFMLGGNSGCTTGLLPNAGDGSHIHLTLRINGKVVDPLPYLITYKKGSLTYIKGYSVTPPIDPCLECKKKVAELEATIARKDKAMRDAIDTLNNGLK